MALPPVWCVEVLALVTNLWFYWVGPYLSFKWRSPEISWTMVSRGIAACGMIHHGGLIGYQGINLLLMKGFRPCEFLSSASSYLAAPELYIRFPTLLWLAGGSCGPGALMAVVVFGGICSTVAFFGICTPLAFFGQYIAILSLCVTGGQVFHYPWDTLMCELSFLAIWLPQPSKPGRLTGIAPLPSYPVRAALYCLCWRVLVGNALIKFWDNPDTGYGSWKDLTYIKHYLEWQGFPTWFAFGIFQLPMFVHYGAEAFTFICQAICPTFMVLKNTWARRIAAAIIAFEMQGIELMGNYGLFNAIPAVLALPLMVPIQDAAGEGAALAGQPKRGKTNRAGSPNVQGTELSALAAAHRRVGSVICWLQMPLGLFHIAVMLIGGNDVMAFTTLGQPEWLWYPNLSKVEKHVRDRGLGQHLAPDQRVRDFVTTSFLRVAEPPLNLNALTDYVDTVDYPLHFSGMYAHILRLAAEWRIAVSYGVFRGHPEGRNGFTVSFTCGGDRWHDVIPPHGHPQDYGNAAAEMSLKHVAPLQSRMDQVYTHNGMLMSYSHGFNWAIYGNWYHSKSVNMLPPLMLGLVSGCCAGTEPDPYGAWALHSPHALPRECSIAKRTAEEKATKLDVRVGVQWHRYHFGDIHDVMAGKPVMQRHELIRQVNFTGDELAAVVQGAAANGSILLGLMLQAEGYKLKGKPSERKGDLLEL